LTNVLDINQLWCFSHSLFYALRGVLHLAVIDSLFVPTTIFLSLYLLTKCRGSIYRIRYNINFKFNVGANPCACTVCSPPLFPILILMYFPLTNCRGEPLCVHCVLALCVHPLYFAKNKIVLVYANNFCYIYNIILLSITFYKFVQNHYTLHNLCFISVLCNALCYLDPLLADDRNPPCW